MTLLHRFTKALCVLVACHLTVSLVAQDGEKPGTTSNVAQDAGKPGALAFRNSEVPLKYAQGTGVPSNPTANPQQVLDDLSEQKQTLEAEIRYAKSKQAAARRKNEAAIAGNQTETAEIAGRDAEDWERRAKNSEAQLAQVEQELQTALQGLQPEMTDDGMIVPGENLEVFVVEDTSFNGRYPVRRGGYIILPQVGRIYVAGKNVDGAETAVKKALEQNQLRQATVMCERIEGIDLESGPVIYLSGEFRHPRPYRIPAGTSPSLVSVILSCGGVSDTADLTRVRIMRVAGFKSVVEEVNVQKILDGGGLTSDVRLNDGDVIMVPAGTANEVWVTGKVRRQGVQRLNPGEKLTVYVAILNAGGFARFADLKKTYILREMPDGTKTKIPVNIKEIQKGDQTDLPVVGNDIIVIPEKFFSF